MKAFINAGHKIGLDSGAVYGGECEAVIAMDCARLVCQYLNAAGVTTILLQSNSLNGEDEDAENPSICRSANESGADIFVSIHCNAAANEAASGTECLVYANEGKAGILADCIQTQIVNSLGTADRGVKERPNLAVLTHTAMPATLVELAFLSNEEDFELLTNKLDEFAKAVARGITDYQSCFSKKEDNYMSKYFSAEELACKCGCGGTTSNPYLLAGLDRIREAIGRPLYVSCAYRCPTHNAEVGGVSNSQHIDGSAADVLQPDGMDFGEFKWYVEEYSKADGIGLYPNDGFIHIDYRDNGESEGKYRW